MRLSRSSELLGPVDTLRSALDASSGSDVRFPHDRDGHAADCDGTDLTDGAALLAGPDDGLGLTGEDDL